MPRPRRQPQVPLISCRDLVELVTAYLEGALDESTRRRVDAHLALCEPCRLYVAQMRSVALGLQDADLPQLPEDVCMEIVRAFRRRGG